MASPSHPSVKKTVKESLTKTFDIFGKLKSFGAEGPLDSFKQNRRFHGAHFSYGIWWVGANLLLVNCLPTTTSSGRASFGSQGSFANPKILKHIYRRE
jgi:hypothetical protein